MKHIILTVLFSGLAYLLMLTGCKDPFEFLPVSEDTDIAIQSAIANYDQVRMTTSLNDFLNAEDNGVSRVDFLTGEAESLGLEVSHESVTTSWMETAPNVIVRKPGVNPLLAPVYVTAHWDYVFPPGADDNGSGCAGLLEIMACLDGLTVNRDIYFIFFAFEEYTMTGSRLHVQNMVRKPRAVLNLEMIGFTSDREVAPEMMHYFMGIPKSGDFIAVFSDKPSMNLGMNYIRMMDDYVPDLPYYLGVVDRNLETNPALEDLYRSDHEPFWKKDIPALFITDTANFREGTPYHTPADTIDKIDFDFMGDIVKATMATVLLYSE